VQADEEIIEHVREGLTDVLIYAIGMSNQLDIDLREAVAEKMAENKERFDAETAAEITERRDRWREQSRRRRLRGDGDAGGRRYSVGGRRIRRQVRSAFSPR